MTTEIHPPSSFDDDALDKAFAQVSEQVREQAAALRTPDEVDAFKLRWTGRKQGRLNDVSGWLKAAPSAAKKSVGERFKVLKDLVEGLLEQAEGAGPTDAVLAAEAIDITLPGSRRLTGAEHPITRTLNEIVSVFAALGYSVGVGPEVLPGPGADHRPGRGMGDTVRGWRGGRRCWRRSALSNWRWTSAQVRTAVSDPVASWRAARLRATQAKVHSTGRVATLASTPATC